MQQLSSIWSGLDPRKRVIAGLAAGAVFIAVLMLSRLATATDMGLLYTGLDNGAAGDVVQALEQSGVAYDVRGNAIYVDRSQRDSLRMTLASQGLPANSGTGYELLDSLNGFGTTSQMFDAAYWRAKEGELARTIVSNPAFRAARVHIATPTGGPFRRDITSTAAVTITPAGNPVTTAQARALQYLIASSVSGMSPKDVSVIDSKGGIVVEETDSISGGDRAEQLKANVERLLTARMGPGKAIVEVSVETVTDRESIVERRFDPEGRVAISTDTEERSTSSSDQGAGAVTVASNLPDGAGGTNRSASSNNSETRERVNFEVSETQRELVIAPGAIRRISVAVMLGGRMVTDAEGQQSWQSLPDQELEALEALVASAVGYDESRGDVITIRSMELEARPEQGSYAENSMLSELNIMMLVQLGVASLTALLLGLLVIRPIFSGPRRAELEQIPAPTGALSGEVDPAPVMDSSAGIVSVISDVEPISNDPVSRLRQMIDDRREETVQILQHWMEDDEEAAR